MSEQLSVDTLPALLPAHKASLHLTHDEHKSNHEPIEHYLEDFTDADFVAPGERERCIANDSAWTLQWYPETPVGFCVKLSSTLEGLLEYLRHRAK